MSGVRRADFQQCSLSRFMHSPSASEHSEQRERQWRDASATVVEGLVSVHVFCVAMLTR